MFGKQVGIDLGTSNLRVYVRGRGVVLNEPTVVAHSATDDRVLFRGVRFTSFFDGKRSGNPDARLFAAAYLKHYGQPATQQAALSYDAATLIGHAALAVGADRARIRDWVASVGVSAPAVQGVTGEIRFDEHGDAVGKPVVIGLITP